MPRPRTPFKSELGKLIDQSYPDPIGLARFRDKLAEHGVEVSAHAVYEWRMGISKPRPDFHAGIAKTLGRIAQEIKEVCDSREIQEFSFPTVSGPPSSHDAGIEEIEEIFKITKIHLNREQFPGAMERKFDDLLENTTNFVCYTRLCNYVRSDNDTHRDTYDLGANIQFRSRVEKSQVKFIRVESFYSRTRFEKALEDGIHFRAVAPNAYTCRFYLPSPTGIPILNFRSWDHRVFYLGGFYPGKRGAQDDFGVLLEAQEPLTTFFTNYWDAVLTNSEPLLNEDLSNARKIALSIGYTPDEWLVLKQRIDALECETSKASPTTI